MRAKGGSWYDAINYCRVLQWIRFFTFSILLNSWWNWIKVLNRLNLLFETQIKWIVSSSKPIFNFVKSVFDEWTRHFLWLWRICRIFVNPFTIVIDVNINSRIFFACTAVTAWCNADQNSIANKWTTWIRRDVMGLFTNSKTRSESIQTHLNHPDRCRPNLIPWNFLHKTCPWVQCQHKISSCCIQFLIEL